MTVLEAFEKMGLPRSNYVLSAFGHHLATTYSAYTKRKMQYEKGIGWIEVRDYLDAEKLKVAIEYAIRHEKVNPFVKRTYRA